MKVCEVLYSYLINKAEQYKIKGKIFYRLDVNNNFYIYFISFFKGFYLGLLFYVNRREGAILKIITTYRYFTF
ncbi:hypothetical protein COB47_1571 [Caldicellulosiruptor obsidiansis OB47]|uniref:Uncharacterized protein n=1 Tax=Caldicellulosiruptor obsidiansis (strain ATCC BAA-2073 / JCM 16842 / OB47) TaxID=608506 RepID=D9TF86_CALOO|nr:hypothetical protein COB47_1571 [Caldicellulosiruptor obsidiansis OB47]